MLLYEGELNELDRRPNLQMKVNHNDGSDIFNIAGVSVEAWEKQVDANISSPMQLNGTFLYFHTRTPTSEELHDCDKIFITPDSSDWNPHCIYLLK